MDPQHQPATHEPADWPEAPEQPFIEIGGQTNIGRTRSTNTDFFIAADLMRSLVIRQSATPFSTGTTWVQRPQGKLLVVADGITGAGMGDVASWTAVEGLARYITCQLPWKVGDEREIVDSMSSAFETAQAHVRRAAMRGGEDERPIGTTLTMAYITWPVAHVLHVGDSRAYLLRNDVLRQLTSDDTLAQQLIERAVLPAERVPSTPFRNILTNAVGGGDDEIDIEYHRVNLEHADRLLLCTDGITRNLSPLAMKRELLSGATAATSCRRLISAALAAGGKDNITAVVARVEAVSP